MGPSSCCQNLACSMGSQRGHCTKGLPRAWAAPAHLVRIRGALERVKQLGCRRGMGGSEGMSSMVCGHWLGEECFRPAAESAPPLIKASRSSLHPEAGGWDAWAVTSLGAKWWHGPCTASTAAGTQNASHPRGHGPAALGPPLIIGLSVSQSSAAISSCTAEAGWAEGAVWQRQANGQRRTCQQGRQVGAASCHFPLTGRRAAVPASVRWACQALVFIAQASPARVQGAPAARRTHVHLRGAV